LAESIGTDFREIPIDEIVAAAEAALAESFAGRERDLTEENLQARARGLLLMGLSNKFGWLVVATGNKSELSVGYATLYGDLAGGALGRRLRPGRGRARRRADRPGRVQAPPGPARRSAHAQGVRPRSPNADNEQMARLDADVARPRRRPLVEEPAQELRQPLR